MRLTEHQIKSIIKNTTLIFGENSMVYLFGSRIDDNELGGDIDLFIECESEYNSFSNEMTFLSLLKRDIGEQRVDLLVKTIDVIDNRAIILEAQKTGILLNRKKADT